MIEISEPKQPRKAIAASSWGFEDRPIIDNVLNGAQASKNAEARLRKSRW
ncbi:uncharacterized protein G2W53_023671 [Senna tora]|uniref:Uncharacterized protein n=1 Tax=Senna tora TaxID=362788 RepID=A0A834TB05_9FABA|nr:uncharacterized protein G2W53_023671 [Senna tora]